MNMLIQDHQTLKRLYPDAVAFMAGAALRLDAHTFACRFSRGIATNHEIDRLFEIAPYVREKWVLEKIETDSGLDLTWPMWSMKGAEWDWSMMALEKVEEFEGELTLAENLRRMRDFMRERRNEVRVIWACGMLEFNFLGDGGKHLYTVGLLRSKDGTWRSHS
jgi:hypothetical protein